MRTRARVTTVAGAATLLCAASTFGVGLSALAAPSTVSTFATQAAAPSPMLVGGCGDTVRGAPGQRVGVRTAGLPVVDVGRVPSSGSSTLDATPALREMLGPVAPACMINAEAITPATAPVEALIAPAMAPARDAVGGVVPALAQPSSPEAPAAPPPAAPAGQPQPAAGPPSLSPAGFGPYFGPTSPPFPYALGLYSSGLPHYNYAELLAIGRPGSLGRLSAGMLTADLFGSRSVSNTPALGKQSAAANDVAAAGRASALEASGVERIALPVLVAVLMLASVSAALLRSWVLGRR
ncbi:MAG: hypothetical protein ACRDRR_15750 [Pseudonocardiaceae bacterium]